MNWNFLITFFAGIGVYLLFLLVFTLIKRYKIKKKQKEDDKQNIDKVEIINNDEEEVK